MFFLHFLFVSFPVVFLSPSAKSKSNLGHLVLCQYYYHVLEMPIGTQHKGFVIAM